MSDVAEALFPLPPFPGATPVRILEPATKPNAAHPGSVKALLDAIRHERVGGAFWGPNDPWLRFASGAVQHFSGGDPMALLAAIAGCPIACSEASQFAPLAGPDREVALHALVAEHLIAAVTWLDPFTQLPTSPVAVVERMGAWRRLIENNRAIGAAFGFAGWKQDTVAGLLWPGTGPAPFLPATTARLDRLPPDDAVAVWKARVPADFLRRLEDSRRPVLEVEDGFIRSIGLGADCVPPLSIVVDDLGAHYDPSRPSRLERLLADSQPDEAKLSRARALREAIAASGISKYGVGGVALPRPGGPLRHILVVGQVEDDRSVLLGGCGLASNHELLRRVRTLCPDAYLIYRPHPDVEAGHRKGHVPPADARLLANQIDFASAISNLIAMVDEVHVLTSLAGFEALLRRKKVVTHGVPFYAGWGLTTDLGPVPERRARNLDLDQLISAVLIDYPLYIDPVTKLPADVELLITRMGAGVRREKGALVALRRVWGRLKRLLARMWK